MTEDEAKTKWCPFARVDSTASNRPNPGDNCDVSAGWPPCIASACMAWRTRPVGSHQRHITPGGVEVRPPTDSVTLDGFCGLAGQP